ncbi:uncharacterized protein B0I36DRAFT_360713 [Microdochium trichocladiopsis]|uniref:Uncharacterized protein n=1 Tax=Microdochium trichocladiopsis TaxID=1682393 RepID=A0A9P9BSY1_9PEZI|nr:uncharacterized protein B0I36DRAFT_360713 [Microdochium trichocladiopsis]KAH7035325.1 hypothetical protein B0I36DRAFT_360713 [Microdochium trichocladiopsis]
MEAPRDKPKSRGGFKGFMKSLTKDLRSQDRRSSSGLQLAASNASGHALQRQVTATSNHTTNTTSTNLPLHQAPLSQPPKPELLGEATELAVHVSLTFEEPLDFSYSRIYEGSPAFRASDAVCQALLRRVDHCCQELITRKDPIALDRTNVGDGTGKPLRFEICTDIIRGSETWASRTYKSYQKQPLTGEAAREVTLSAHQIIGLFMRQHDDGFVWKDGPFREEPLPAQETFPYRPGRVQPLTCVPRNLFLEKPQSFERIPGYSVQIEITSQNHLPKPREWQKTIEINSTQATPLDAALGEDLFFETSYAVEGILRTARKAFIQRHLSCTSSRRCARCRPHEGDGLELKITVTNNIGPRFEHLNRTIRSNLGGFLVDIDSDETIDMLNSLGSACYTLRDELDQRINARTDIELTITELRGRGWTLDEPLHFTIGTEKSHCRRDTEAILDRVQTGLASVLRGNALKVRMTAHKRGHFIMDKTLVAREPFEAAAGSPLSGQITKRPKPNDKSREQVVERLQKQINKDIDMVTLDTLTVVEPEEEPETKPLQRTAYANAIDTAETVAGARQAVTIGTIASPKKLHDEPLSPGRTKRANTIGSLLSIPLLERDDHQAAAPLSISDTNVTDETDRPSLLRQSTRAIRDPDTGARAFPLVPPAGKYSGVDETSLDLHEDPRVQRGSDVGTTLTATDNSLTPSTPSLVGADGPSTTSSIIITPRVHESLRRSSRETRKTESVVSSEVSSTSLRREDSASSRGFVAVPRLQTASSGHKSTPSPLHNEQIAAQNLDTDADLLTSPPEDIGQQQPKARPGAHAIYDDAEFAQSKPDFDFSSPTPVSPMSNASDVDLDQSVPTLGLDAAIQDSPRMSRIEHHHQQHHTLPRTKQRSAIPAIDTASIFDTRRASSRPSDKSLELEPSDDVDDIDDDTDHNEEAIESGPPSPAQQRPSTSSGPLSRSPSGTFPAHRPGHQHRKSLGSAGFLGSFRDDRVAEIIGLRKALMLSPPGAGGSAAAVPPVPPLPRHMGTRSLSVDATKLMRDAATDDDGGAPVRPGTSGGLTVAPRTAEADDDIPPVPAIPALVSSKSE